jgi:hypothetical protein
LRTQADWVVATRAGSASTYAAAALAIRQLVDAKGLGAVTQTLTSLGSSASFEGAFGDAFGQPVSSVDAVVSAYAYGAFMGSFPVGISADRGALPVNERLQLAFVGLKPGEGVAWTFLGPGSCSGRGSSSGSSDGFSSFWFVVRADSQARCAGSWTAVGAGDQGSSGRFDFRFTATN